MTTHDMKADLLDRLQTAAELEAATIPPYLTALLSIKHTANRGAAESIRSVMTEEMLHLALVANVALSVGGSMRITGKHLPTYPLKLSFKGKAFTDREFDVHLAPFSEETITTFMAIEQPREPELYLAEFKKITIPERTIGEFYDSIIVLLEQLHAALGEQLFVGDPAKQITPDYYWSAGGHPIPVTDLGTAKAALNEVIHQGEGATDVLDDGDGPKFGQPLEVAHFFRFKEIYCHRRYRAGDLPSGEPSGDVLPVDYTAVYPIKVDARSPDYAAGSPLARMNIAFNLQYTRMLKQLEEALNGSPKILYTAIMNGMHGLGEMGIQMMSTAIDGDQDGLHGCPTFEWLED